MSNAFIDALRYKVRLTEIEQDVLRSSGINNPERLLSLANNFPSLARIGFDLAKLTNAVSRDASNAVMTVLHQPGGPPIFAHGADCPPNTASQPGYTVPIGFSSNPLPVVNGKKIGVPISNWPVRDQGQRGTCVAFALTACREYLATHNNAAFPELSEQYLFWATKKKTRDPRPDSDGTRIEYAKEALELIGVCNANLWVYNNIPEPSNVTHTTPNNPSSEAHSDAINWQHRASHFNSIGNAVELYNLLHQTNKPVAISVGVFADAYDPNRLSNWNMGTSVLYGDVIDPPPTSVSVGGHAVCVIGFEPDQNETSGGYFIFRNSWGDGWGRSLPESGYYAPEKGYGQISATYINKYLWEMCSL